MSWEMIVGLETHVELQTETKMFCRCKNHYGAQENTLVCPVCLGLPGTLPMLNEHTVELAVTAGFALNCKVNPVSSFDRKNYFYPDLPKGYQITQFYHPLCEYGFLEIYTEGIEKRIGIRRIHIEEDAGKLKHQTNFSVLDMNRCGVPLIEIVTEPEIRSSKEASAYLRELQSVLRFAGVSSCRMNEGSLRCDVNISVHHPGTDFGERCEIKNLNSFQSVEKAIEYEYMRQCSILENGGTLRKETRRFDEKIQKTVLMRDKEESADYRYFPEPDLPVLQLEKKKLQQFKETLPTLPKEYYLRFVCDYKISKEYACQLSHNQWLAKYTLETAAMCLEPNIMAQLLSVEGFRLMNLKSKEETDFSFENWNVSRLNMSLLSNLVSNGTINYTTAKMLLVRMAESDFDPVETVKNENLAIVRDQEAIADIVQQVMNDNRKLVELWLSGKTNVAKALMGKCISAGNGKLYAPDTESILLEQLKSIKKEQNNS